MASPSINVGAKGGIITHGLGLPACQGMIVNFPFRLSCFIVPPPPKDLKGHAGSIPLEPGEIHDFYKPIPPEYYPEGSRELADPSIYNKKVVKVKVTSSYFPKMEKEYLITEDKAKAIIEVARVANVTMEKFNVVVTGIKRILTEGVVRITNLRKKYWK